MGPYLLQALVGTQAHNSSLSLDPHSRQVGFGRSAAVGHLRQPGRAVGVDIWDPPAGHLGPLRWWPWVSTSGKQRRGRGSAGRELYVLIVRDGPRCIRVAASGTAPLPAQSPPCLADTRASPSSPPPHRYPRVAARGRRAHRMEAQRLRAMASPAPSVASLRLRRAPLVPARLPARPTTGPHQPQRQRGPTQARVYQIDRPQASLWPCSLQLAPVGVGLTAGWSPCAGCAPPPP